LGLDEMNQHVIAPWACLFQDAGRHVKRIYFSHRKIQRERNAFQ